MKNQRKRSGPGRRLRPLGSLIASLSTIAGIGMLAYAPNASASVTGRVITTNGDVLHIRATPSVNGTVIGVLGQGAIISFSCYVNGDPDTGPYGTETVWDHVDGTNGYVPDAWIYTGSNGAVVPQCSTSPAAPSGGSQYRIAFTGGSGVYPRASTSMASAKVGSVMPEGSVVTITCETSGQAVTDTAGYTISWWDRMSTGDWVANAYLYTGINGRTPGVPDCGSGGTAPPPVNPQYNRSAAVAWALAHANDPQAFPAECTWFVSNALWAGGFARTADWTSAGSHGIWPKSYRPGSIDAWSVPNLKQYLLAHYSSTWTPLNDLSVNAVPAAQPGDIIIYSWDGGKSLEHMSFVTSIASGHYPNVSEWGTPEFTLLNYAYYEVHHPREGYSARGWTYSQKNHAWLQTVYHGQARAYLLHINGGYFVSSF